MTFEHLKSENLIILRMRRAFEVKLITFLQVSKVLSFMQIKQFNKNIADATLEVKFRSLEVKFIVSSMINLSSNYPDEELKICLVPECKILDLSLYGI